MSTSKIRCEVLGTFRQYRKKYQMEDKLQELASKFDSDVVEKISFSRHIHEPASYNDWKKTKSESIVVDLVIPEMKEYEGIFGKPHKSSVIFTYKHTFTPIQEIFGKGFVFDGIDCRFDEDGRKSVSVKFEKETRV